IPHYLQLLQPDLEGETVACVAPFKIDRSKVSNSDYLAFWASIPESEREKPEVIAALYPWGWGAPGNPFPPSIRNYPVIGVPMSGAALYASWRGKRLPTPYEWCLAAFGPKGVDAPPAWFARYIADRQQTWERIRQLHEDKLTELIRGGESYADVSSRVYCNAIPWLPKSASGEVFGQWSKEATKEALTPLRETWKEPDQLLPNGSRPFDKSEYGVQDMILNGAELVVPSPSPPYSSRDITMAVVWKNIKNNAAADTPYRVPMGVNGDGIVLPELRANIAHYSWLSLIFHRANFTPLGMEKLMMRVNVEEMVNIFRPLLGWDFYPMVAGAYDHPPVWIHPFLFLFPPEEEDRTGFRQTVLRLWKPQPSQMRIEMGRPLPYSPDLPAVDRGLPSFDKAGLYVGAALHEEVTFLFPTGFRCAR
ncbi:MAG TPA: SUMF1/EgtB/PvdO family nonheme iron enzyme, partial [Chthonomonadaceae bacterium]|nr:SUMF1/EgtB/PvdO family nonheme iron enzyme [Chthonomonadaceae bacterium]